MHRDFPSGNPEALGLIENMPMEHYPSEPEQSEELFPFYGRKGDHLDQGVTCQRLFRHDRFKRMMGNKTPPPLRTDFIKSYYLLLVGREQRVD